MARCIMGHGDGGYCEHCPGEGTEGGDKRVALVNDRFASVLTGWEYADTSVKDDEWLPVAEEYDSAELRALDASLSLDAGLCAGAAVREFAERLAGDVSYALRQLRRADPGLDAVSRALDALERVEGRLAVVMGEDAGV